MEERPEEERLLAHAEKLLRAIDEYFARLVDREAIGGEPKRQLAVATVGIPYGSLFRDRPALGIREYVSSFATAGSERLTSAVEERARASLKGNLRRIVSGRREEIASFEYPNSRVAKRLWRRHVNVGATVVVLEELWSKEKWRPEVVWLNHSIAPGEEEAAFVLTGERALYDAYTRGLLRLLEIARRHGMLIIGITPWFEERSLVKHLDAALGTDMTVFERPSALFGNDYILLNGCEPETDGQAIKARAGGFPLVIMPGPQPFLRCMFEERTASEAVNSMLDGVRVIYHRSSADAVARRAEYYVAESRRSREWCERWREVRDALYHGYIGKASAYPECLERASGSL